MNLIRKLTMAPSNLQSRHYCRLTMALKETLNSGLKKMCALPAIEPCRADDDNDDDDN